MTRLIYADELMKYTHDVTLANGARHRCIDATVIYDIPTVDAVPVEWIENYLRNYRYMAPIEKNFVREMIKAWAERKEE